MMVISGKNSWISCCPPLSVSGGGGISLSLCCKSGWIRGGRLIRTVWDWSAILHSLIRILADEVGLTHPQLVSTFDTSLLCSECDFVSKPWRRPDEIRMYVLRPNLPRRQPLVRRAELPR